MPASVTAATGIDDAMAHAIGAYTSWHKKNPMSLAWSVDLRGKSWKGPPRAHLGRSANLAVVSEADMPAREPQARDGWHLTFVCASGGLSRKAAISQAFYAASSRLKAQPRGREALVQLYPGLTTIPLHGSP